MDTTSEERAELARTVKAARGITHGSAETLAMAGWAIRMSDTRPLAEWERAIIARVLVGAAIDLRDLQDRLSERMRASDDAAAFAYR